MDPAVLVEPARPDAVSRGLALMAEKLEAQLRATTAETTALRQEIDELRAAGAEIPRTMADALAVMDDRLAAAGCGIHSSFGFQCANPAFSRSPWEKSTTSSAAGEARRY